MTRMDEVRRNGMANAFDAGVQKGADLILCALALEFGFGPERMRRLRPLRSAQRVYSADELWKAGAAA